MDTTSIKNYAPKARRDLIEAVTRRAAKYGITEKQIAGVEERGELYLIDGEAFGKREAAQCRKLDESIQRDGFHHVMESIAYTWFSELAAATKGEPQDP